MAAARQQVQHAAGGPFVLGLAEDSPAQRHDRVGGDDEGVRRSDARSPGLGHGQTHGELARRLVLEGRFVDIGGNHLIGFDPHLTQQIETPGTGAGQDQRGANKGGD